MAKPRFYEPGPIKPHPRVRHKHLDVRSDEYVGEEADLIEAGVLKPGMFPPRISWSWRPAGDPRAGRESVSYMPGYITITKVLERGCRAVLTVSREEQAARQDAAKRRTAQWHAEMRARRAERQEQPGPGEKRCLENGDAFREMGQMYAKLIERYGQHGHEGFVLASDDQQAVLELASELQDLLRSARVVDTRRRQHLTLAWSA